MFVRIVRMAAGFALASLAAAAALVAFVYAPADWAGLLTDLNGDRLSEAGYFALVITPWVALCAALPVLALALFAESRRIGGFTFYALAGIATAAAAFLVQHYSEPPGAPGIFQAYALIAFLAAGLIGGVVYWIAAGRYAARTASKAPKAS
jgi:hypothetical protein